MNNVNRNVETMKQEFETMSQKEKYVEQKLDTLDNTMRQKLNTMEKRLVEKLDTIELRAKEPLAVLENKLDKIDTTSRGRLSRKFFLFFNILLVPIAKYTWASLWPTKPPISALVKT